MSTIDETGMILDDFATSKANALAKLKVAFGDNLKDDDQSLAGIFSTLLGEMTSDQNDLIREVASARNPQGATGVFLANICQFNGITKRAPAFSTVALSCTALSTGSTIPAGSLVQDPTDSAIEFETDEELVLGADATGSVSATATAAGAINAAGGTLTKIVNPVFGWASVTNSAAASPGRAIETDTDLRFRRKYVSRQTGLQSLPKVYAALTNIDEIGRVTVRENKTNYVDSRGQLPHSIWAVCQGGADQDIAAALHTSKSGGINYHGATSVTYPDPVTGRDYVIKFDRVTEVPVQIYLRLLKGASYPADGDDQIKAAIIAYFAGEFVKTDGETDNGFSIAENVGYFRITTPVNSIGGHSIQVYTLGYLGETLGTSDLLINQTELATIAAEDIEIVTY